MDQEQGQQQHIMSVLGSAYQDDDDGDPALRVLVARLEEIERTQRLQEARNQAALEEKDKKYQALLFQMAAEKNEAEQALKAALEKIQEIQEARPQDPSVTAQIVQKLEKEAQESIARKRKRFIAKVKGMPRGTVFSSFPHSIILTINGVSALVNPGKNELPEAYITAWEEYLEQKNQAQHYVDTLSGPAKEYGDLERLIAGERAAQVVETIDGPITVKPSTRGWDENTGVINVSD